MATPQQVVRHLLDCDPGGGHVDVGLKSGITPLMVACNNGHLEVARLLLDAGV